MENSESSIRLAISSASIFSNAFVFSNALVVVFAFCWLWGLYTAYTHSIVGLWHARRCVARTLLCIIEVLCGRALNIFYDV